MYYVILVFLCIPIKMCLSGAHISEKPGSLSSGCPAFLLCLNRLLLRREGIGASCLGGESADTRTGGYGHTLAASLYHQRLARPRMLDAARGASVAMDGERGDLTAIIFGRHHKSTLGSQTGKRCGLGRPAGKQIQNVVHRLEHHRVDRLYHRRLLRTVMPVDDEEVGSCRTNQRLHAVNEHLRLEACPCSHDKCAQSQFVHHTRKSFLVHLIILQGIAGNPESSAV